ncbi:MAG TPA: glycosyltransferase family 4 protein [Terriglobales bacterium]|nr:glycosyltransferase family 4 protein [Terriglobales bacterium]
MELPGQSSKQVPEKRVCRILVDSLADAGLTNAQMTNAREIVIRLDPERFQVRMFHVDTPDERIRKLPNLELIRLPRRGQTLRIFREFAFGPHEILFYLKVAPASRWYMELRKAHRDQRVVIGSVESRADIRNEPTVPKAIARMWEQTVLRCDYLFSNSQAVRHSLQREFGLASEVVPTGVDTKFFVPDRERGAHARPRVLFVGSLRPFKQPQMLLEAARRFPQADFVIVGDGEMAAELKARKVQEKLDNVTLSGGLDAAALRTEYQRADAFLFPSTWEGSPKVLLEAAACGLPVIARRNYEPESVVDQTTGYLVGSDEELFARLEELLGNAELRRKLGTAGRRHAEGFDWDLIAKKWEEVFLRVRWPEFAGKSF